MERECERERERRWVGVGETERGCVRDGERCDEVMESV